jgi:hypothetical protein
MASTGVGIASALTKLTVAELAAHTARLKNATAENTAMDATIPPFDADLKAIAQAFSNGSASAATCIQACLEVDNNIFTYLYGLTQNRKPGVAWNGPTTTALGPGNLPVYTIICDKSCTASCCVYLNNLRPAIFGRGGLSNSYAPWQTGNGTVIGLIQLIQKGGGTLKVITVAPPSNPKYGTYGRTGYNLTLAAPPAQAVIATTVAEMTGGGSLALPDGTVVKPAGIGSEGATLASQGSTTNGGSASSVQAAATNAAPLVAATSIGGTSALSLPLIIVLGIGLLVLAFLLGGKQ